MILNILCCQSPALFLVAIILLVRYFITRKAHRVKATVRLVFAILCAILGIVCYFVGMYRDIFTIKDFYQIRVAGWFGLVVVVLVCGLLVFNALKDRTTRRKLDKAVKTAEEEKNSALEQAVEQTMRQTRDAVQKEELQKRLDLAQQQAEREAEKELGKEQPISLTLEPKE